MRVCARRVRGPQHHGAVVRVCGAALPVGAAPLVRAADWLWRDGGGGAACGGGGVRAAAAACRPSGTRRRCDPRPRRCCPVSGCPHHSPSPSLALALNLTLTLPLALTLTQPSTLTLPSPSPSPETRTRTRTRTRTLGARQGAARDARLHAGRRGATCRRRLGLGIGSTWVRVRTRALMIDDPNLTLTSLTLTPPSSTRCPRRTSSRCSRSSSSSRLVRVS